MLGFQPTSLSLTIRDETARWPAVRFDNGSLICVERPTPTILVASPPDTGPDETGPHTTRARSSDIDGVAIEWVDATESSDAASGNDQLDGSAFWHPNRASSLDHIVINTDSIERTSSAVERILGLPQRRVREVESTVDGRRMQIRQAFHRFADRGCILELVERRTPDENDESNGDGTTPSSIFGAVAIVDDLDDVARQLGDELISVPRPAVQPGRAIATVRRSAGLPIALALMTPEPPRS